MLSYHPTNKMQFSRSRRSADSALSKLLRFVKSPTTENSLKDGAKISSVFLNTPQPPLKTVLEPVFKHSSLTVAADGGHTDLAEQLLQPEPEPEHFSSKVGMASPHLGGTLAERVRVSVCCNTMS